MSIETADSFMAIFGFKRVASIVGKVITPVFEFECGTCGDYHMSDNVPYPCETGGWRMMNDKNLILSILIAGLIGLPIAMAIDRDTDLLVDYQYGYTPDQLHAMDSLVNHAGEESSRKNEARVKSDALADGLRPSPAPKHVTYRKQAAALKDVWMVSEAEIEKPINLFNH